MAAIAARPDRAPQGPAPSPLPAIVLGDTDVNRGPGAAPAQLPHIYYISLEIVARFYDYSRRRSLCRAINPLLRSSVEDMWRMPFETD